VRLVSLDDLIGEPWQYGISLAYALFRGFCDLGAAMTETYMLFLNADFVLADGCYERLIPHMRRGESVLLSPSYCVVEEEVEPLLAQIRSTGNGALTAQSRTLARMIIDHRHNTIRAKTISQQDVHFEYMDQAYWQVDNDTIIAHQMPICIVAMRPEQALTDINTFWDWGITYEFCPSRQLTVLGDSDDFLILELRSEAAHRDLIRPGPATPQAVAARMQGHITHYQVDNARFPLTLHAGPLPHGIDEGRAKLRAFLDEVSQPLIARAPDHRNHPQWIYHRWHLSRHIEVRRLRSQIVALNEQSEKERIRARKMQDGALSMLAATMAPEFDAICERLSEGQSASTGGVTSRGTDGALVAAAEKFVRQADVVERFFQRTADRSAARCRELSEPLQRQLRAVEGRALTWDDVGYCGAFWARIVSGESVGSEPEGWSHRRLFGILRRISVSALGSVPHTRRWHPLHFICKDIAALLDGAARAGGRLLFVSGPRSIASRWSDPSGRPHLRVSPAGLLDGAMDALANSTRFDFCFIELDFDTFPRIRDIYRVVADHVSPGSGVVICWVNSSCEAAAALRHALVECAAMQREGAAVRFYSSSNGWGGLDVARAAREKAGLRRLAGLGAGLVTNVLDFAPGRPAEGQRALQNCWGVIVEIGACSRTGTVSQRAPSAAMVQPPNRSEISAAT
jgi:hypothetical protein